MTLEVNEEQATFFAQMKSLFEIQDPADSLANLRAKSWDHFEELGLPHRKTEVFQYVRLNKLFAKSFSLPCKVAVDIKNAILPECKTSVVVFVNGSLDLTLSNVTGLPQKVVCIPLKEALKSFGAFVNNQLAKGIQEEIDPFAALNAAFIQKALFFYVPPGTILPSPVQILHVVTGQNLWLSPRLDFFFGALSEANVVLTTYHVDSSGNAINGVTNFALEEGAQVSFSRVLFDAPVATWHFDATRAVLKKDSHFTSVIAENGAETYRDDYKIALVGTNADVHLNGVAMLQGKQESHTHVLIDHQAPECRSLQLFKNCLDDVSKASFEGKIYVHKIAQKTAAFQLNNNLLLSEGAQSNSKPNLEIFADDVQASHGATFGSIDEENLFYLRTRGISKEVAKNLLVQGFCLEVINKLKIPSLFKQAKEKLLK